MVFKVKKVDEDACAKKSTYKKQKILPKQVRKNLFVNFYWQEANKYQFWIDVMAFKISAAQE